MGAPQSPASHMLVGVDVGGTFTDLFVFDPDNKRYLTGKVPTTLDNQAIGIVDGLSGLVPSMRPVGTIIHGTTTATNALLERRGAPTGLIATAGFRDVLEMRRRDRPRTWGLTGSFTPVIPRDMRLEVDERVMADGTVLQALRPAEAVAAARQLVDKGAQSIAVCFINAYANADNERAAVDAIAHALPDLFVQASHEILPEIREFERTSTAVLNAYLRPPLSRYLTRLDDTLRGQGFDGQVLIVQSNGGVMTVDTAAKLPVRTALSGPAAGVIAAAHIANEAGFANIITGDMGGTSFDVSLVANGTNTVAPETAIDFGLVIRTPMIEIRTIGAGGGSIATVDSAGFLAVGPESAGSNPGPVCYGKGNSRPTVTDANLVLGRINAERPIGGELARLDRAAAETAIHTHIADPLGLTVMAAAEAIVDVANAQMAGAIRLVSIEKGHDPRRFAFVPFGGGGALHACALMADVGLAHALIPLYPGITSAIGCVVADMRDDGIRTVLGALDTIDLDGLKDAFDTLEAGGRAVVAGARGLQSVATRRALDMSYAGQSHTVTVPLTDGDLTRAGIRQAFEDTYRGLYGTILESTPIRVLNARLATIGQRPKIDLGALVPSDTVAPAEAIRDHRSIWTNGTWRSVPVYDRLRLRPGARIVGPALFEQPDTTIYLETGFVAETDRFANIILTRLDDDA